MAKLNPTATHRGPAAPLSCVYDGRECLGFILSRGRSGFEAFDREERSLGFFKTAAAAANVVSAASTNEEATT
jgi:hypothetical protein